MGQVIQVILTYAGPHQSTSEDVDKGRHGVWSNKAEPSKPPSGLSLLPSPGYALLLAPQLHGPESAVFF